MNKPKEGSRSVLGDIHGHSDRAAELLKQAGFMADDGSWAGGDAVLWFMGDFLDRGPAGAEAVRMAIRLQEEAASAGGWVGSLLGNHEIMLLGVSRFGEERPDLLRLWQLNGGRESDLRSLGTAELEWISSLPAAARLGDDLLVHCDSDFYLSYGRDVDDINDRINAILVDGGSDEFFSLMESFFRRFELWEEEGQPAALSQMLEALAARRVVHGHTPIPTVTQVEPSAVTEPLEYSGGRCLNVDGGIYLGGPGFVVPLG